MFSKRKLSLIFFLFAIFSSFFPLRSFSQEEEIEIYFFYNQGCPHCKKEKQFIEGLEAKYPDVVFHKYETSSEENLERFIDFLEEKDVPKEKRGFVPTTFLGDEWLVGYLSDEITGKQIEDYILSFSEKEEPITEVISEKDDLQYLSQWVGEANARGRSLFWLVPTASVSVSAACVAAREPVNPAGCRF